MPLLLSCQSLTASFGAVPLFEDISLGIFDGDRVGLIGPNGFWEVYAAGYSGRVRAPDLGGVAVRKERSSAMWRRTWCFLKISRSRRFLERGLSDADKLKLVPQALGQLGLRMAALLPV